MRIVVTGAGGKLGSCAADALIRAGHDVVALDVAQYRPLSFELRAVDLRDARSVAEAIVGAEAIVHAGNIPNVNAAAPLTVIQDNLRMNVNVIEAALDAGVRSLVFASSIQVISGLPTPTRGQQVASRVAYLPLDGRSPVNPANQYAVSKRMTEVMLSDYAVPSGLQAVAVRFPVLIRLAEESEKALGGWGWHRRRPHPHPHHHKHPHGHQRRFSPWGAPQKRAEGLSYLSLEDAADLIQVLVEQDVPGYRVYMPALCRLAPEQVPQVVEKFYPGVPLKMPREQMTSLVDNTQVIAETGWRPQRARDPIVVPEEAFTGTE